MSDYGFDGWGDEADDLIEQKETEQQEVDDQSLAEDSFDFDSFGQEDTAESTVDNGSDDGFDFDAALPDGNETGDTGDMADEYDAMDFGTPVEEHDDGEKAGFDIDSLFDSEGESPYGNAGTDEVVVDVDLSKYENAEDSGAVVVLALVSGDNIAYLTHGTQGRLAATIKYLEQSVGTALMQIPLGDENIDELKNDARAFSNYYKKHLEGN